MGEVQDLAVSCGHFLAAPLPDDSICAADPASSTSPRRLVLPAQSVLLIDDDLGICDTFMWGFRLAGIRLDTAPCGAEALVKARRSRFDLMLVDLRLPDT